jgi:hypothetical protein
VKGVREGGEGRRGRRRRFVKYEIPDALLRKFFHGLRLRKAQVSRLD